jgi:hypothetical protein
VRRETHGPRDGYRAPSGPTSPGFTVITVRRGEYAEPKWLRSAAELVRRWRKRPR